MITDGGRQGAGGNTLCWKAGATMKNGKNNSKAQTLRSVLALLLVAAMLLGFMVPLLSILMGG